MASDERVLQGIPAAPGLAIGVVVRYARALATDDAPLLDDESVGPEIARFHAAIERTRSGISSARAALVERVSEREAAVFDAHLLVLDDPAFVDETERRIRDERRPAASAVQATVASIRKLFAAIEDEYLRERASDIQDVANQVVRALGSGDAAGTQLPDASIVVAEELFPSDTASLDLSRVTGLVTERGSATAHVAILARALGIPTVVGVAGVLDLVSNGEQAVLDGDAGVLTIGATPETLAGANERAEQQRADRERQDALRDEPAVTTNGVRVILRANIGSPDDAAAALRHGTEGVGLFRTEFLFLDRHALPTEDEQYDAYRRAAEAFAGAPVTIRTLDAGGDKPMPGITDRMEPEANPFLGVRGLRLTLAFPDLFRTQLRALLRAAAAGDIWIMFPMVATLDDVHAARQAVDDAIASLVADSVDHRADPPLGIMIEVPSAAIAIDQLIDEVDFVSIGTNDLVQYTLAADRTNAAVASRYGAFEPAVLRLIANVAEVASAHGKAASVCGEMGGDPRAIPLLLRLGIRELSMTATSIPAAKELIRGLSLAGDE